MHKLVDDRQTDEWEQITYTTESLRVTHWITIIKSTITKELSPVPGYTFVLYLQHGRGSRRTQPSTTEPRIRCSCRKTKPTGGLRDLQEPDAVARAVCLLCVVAGIGDRKKWKKMQTCWIRFRTKVLHHFTTLYLCYCQDCM